MSFATELAKVSGALTAMHIAEATGASKRTVENWRSGRNAPNIREWSSLLLRVKRARDAADGTPVVVHRM